VIVPFGDALGRMLEEGRFRSALPRALEKVWSHWSRAERDVPLPRGAAVIGVGGPTLGGSYKTPVTLALARVLAERGERVAIVTHGYGSTVGAARRATECDDVRDVGDDAAWLARDREGIQVPVFVARRRAHALALAAQSAPTLVVDSLLQTAPERLALALLVVDAREPWGAGACPPAGDLRATKQALLAAADAVVAVSADPHADAPRVSELAADARRAGLPTFVVTRLLSAIRAGSGSPVRLTELSSRPVGLVLAIARPARVTTELAAHGIHPVILETFRDHATPRGRGTPKGSALDAWLTTPKCATKLETTYRGAPLVVLRQQFRLPDALIELARRRADFPPRDVS
jgi:tetraacyldisaccharide 4'-kinase